MIELNFSVQVGPPVYNFIHKIVKKPAGTIMQRFSARVVNNWNGLEEETATADSVMTFGKNLSRLGY